MRILIVTLCLPWPLKYGGNAAQFSTLKALSQDHRFTLLAPANREEEMALFEQLRHELPGVRVVAVPLFTPKVPPPAPKPGQRVMAIAKQAVKNIRTLVRSVLASGGDAAVPTEQTAARKPRAPLPYWSMDERMVQAVATESAQAYDLVQIEFVDFLPLVFALPPGLPSLFIHHQVHHQLMKRFAEAQGGEDDVDRFRRRWVWSQETAFLNRFDSIVTFSEFDRALLAKDVGAGRVHCSPFPIPFDVPPQTVTRGEFSGSFFFLGPEDHFPNVDALDWMLGEIWPAIRQHLPNARLKVVGVWSPGAIQARSAHAGVEFLGFVKDLTETMKNGIMLLPLRIGSGIRTKLLASFAAGVPVVSSSAGCEGIPAEHGKHVRIADEPESFVAQSLLLAKDPGARESQARLAQALVDEVFSPNAVRSSRNRIYQAIVAGKTPSVHSAASIGSVLSTVPSEQSR